jgi:hypothetical protein
MVKIKVVLRMFLGLALVIGSVMDNIWQIMALVIL